MPFLSVVIPAYNEEARLPATLRTILGYLERTVPGQFEILVVDDGSSDRTAALTERVACERTEVRLLRNPGNRGKGYSVRHGMLEARGDWVLFTDADLSAPIEELEKLRAAVEREQAAIAIGSRALDRSLIGVHQPWWREWAGRVFNGIMRLVVGLPFLDTQCGFKLFRRDAVEAIFPRQRIERFGFDVEILYLARKLGFKTVEVPVRWNHAEGTRVSMLRDSVDMFLDLLRVRWWWRRGRYRSPAPPRVSS
ncbi:MAG: glycosyltransferase family 2 protein [Bryobacterales bacterium]|nr:glycosyltransferase family 2 protein [Bryobacteraceae bacterium]MDW8130757.1 glycosyltransferase family 2 protein [Bryobacterales bacterium]